MLAQGGTFRSRGSDCLSSQIIVPPYAYLLLVGLSARRFRKVLRRDIYFNQSEIIELRRYLGFEMFHNERASLTFTLRDVLQDVCLQLWLRYTRKAEFGIHVEPNSDLSRQRLL